TNIEPFGIGHPENYYAWTWGSALFVVLDVYRDQNDSSAKPGAWNWSLGLPQYTWLKNTLENSTATYKFVFAHHIRGQGRGGITNAKLFEWGGYDGQGGTNYNFPNKRPGWAKPIHQLFKDNGVNIFFQGHDHVFAHELMDQVTYQSLPMAADSTYEIGMLANADAYTSDTIAGSGHLRVQVSPSCVKVDFIKAYLPADTLNGKHHNREIAFSYTIGNCIPNGVPELSNQDKVEIYPNPAQKIISVKNNQNNTLPILRLMNMNGQILQQNISHAMNIEEIPNGLYLLEVIMDGKISTHKIFILHE
ncbi:MAG: T9SS type A sorting domain-containing protein, partial [Bacteroidia bacterium]